jgi:HEPN domain-containing protein
MMRKNNNSPKDLKQEELPMKTVNIEMTKAAIIEVMTEAGMMFSKDLTKKDLIALYDAQTNKSEEDVNMNEENKEVIEAAEEVIEEGAVTVVNTEAPQGWTEADTSTEEELPTFNEEQIDLTKVEVPDLKDVAEPIVGEWYLIEGVVKQYEAPAEEIEVLDEAAQTADDKAVEDVANENADFLKTITEDTKKPEEEKENKRKVGKGVYWFVNGEQKEVFPSIKAAATAIKELKGLKNMPFTPIMKSARQGIDWNENSFWVEGVSPGAFPGDKAAETPATEEAKTEEVAKDSTPDTEEIVEIVEELVEDKGEATA